MRPYLTGGGAPQGDCSLLTLFYQQISTGINLFVTYFYRTFAMCKKLKCDFKFVKKMYNILIKRDLLNAINKVFRYFPVLTLTGPRQSGKTTLCRRLFAELPYYKAII